MLYNINPCLQWNHETLLPVSRFHRHSTQKYVIYAVIAVKLHKSGGECVEKNNGLVMVKLHTFTALRKESKLSKISGECDENTKIHRLT